MKKQSKEQKLKKRQKKKQRAARQRAKFNDEVSTKLRAFDEEHASVLRQHLGATGVRIHRDAFKTKKEAEEVAAIKSSKSSKSRESRESRESR